MKKILSTFFVLIALLAMTTGAAFAGSALELVEVRNDEGVPTFVFRVTGEFSQEELQNGFVKVGGEDFPLFCAQQNADTVVCHTSKAASGHEVVVGFGGASFWDRVPEQGPAPQYCYNVYDWSYPEPSSSWVDYGDVCGESPVQNGAVIQWYNSVFGQTYDYIFGPNSSVGTPDGPGWNNPGPGYYYIEIASPT